MNWNKVDVVPPLGKVALKKKRGFSVALILKLRDGQLGFGKAWIENGKVSFWTEDSNGKNPIIEWQVAP